MPPHEVVLFLELVRKAIEDGRMTYRRSRQKNVATLDALGWRPSEMYACVAALSPQQALGSPWANRNEEFPSERTCEFGTWADGQQVYIKITIGADDDGALGCVVSLHFAEKPLTFPFR